MNSHGKTLRKIVFEAASEASKNFPESHGQLHKLFVLAFEKAIYKTALQFCRGNRNTLSNMLGVGIEKSRPKLKKYKATWFGCYPRNAGWIDYYETLNPITDKEGTLEYILSHLEFDIMRGVTLYLLQANKRSLRYFYDIALEEIETPLIVFAFAFSDGDRLKAGALLGLSQYRLHKMLTHYRIMEADN